MNTPVRVVLFYILTFIFTIILGGTQQVLGIGNWIILPQLSPGLAALIMMASFRKDNVKPTISVKRSQTPKYIGAVGVPLSVSVVLFLIFDLWANHRLNSGKPEQVLSIGSTRRITY